MSDNHWNQQNGHDPAGPTFNGNGRSGSLLRNYNAQQPQTVQPYAPPSGPGSPGQFSPSSHLPSPAVSPGPPAVQPPQQPLPPAQRWPSSPPLLANAMQTVRRWSGKVVAARGRANPADQNPLVLYRPTPPRPHTLPAPVRPKPWKRSRALRISMQMRRRRTRWQHSGPNAQKIAIIATSIFLALVIVLASSTIASAYAYYQSQLPRLQGIANQQVDQTTRIYDRNGNLLYTLFGSGGRRTPVSYKYIPKVLQDAQIAAEDPTFWTNSGVDPQGILRAATQYASSGAVESGGSTLTQQLIKNLTGDTQVTLQRKLPEAALAIGLTQQYPKWKILEMYVNVSPYGAQELGAEAAAEDYFGLKPKCDVHFNCTPALALLALNSKGKPDPILGLARASLLAGIVQNPVEFDPTVSPANVQRALARQDYVLNQMLNNHMSINLGLGDQDSIIEPVTPAVIQQVEALTKKMTFPGFLQGTHAPHFVWWVITTLANVLGNYQNIGANGISSTGFHTLLTGGFNIRTSLDLNLETYVENAAKRHLRQPELQPFTGGYGPLNITNNVNDSATVVMNAKTGEVLAMNGSTDWTDRNPKVDGQYNAALASRSPGSTFKSIVLAAAMEMGWYEGITLPDVKTYFPKGYPQSDPVNAVTTYVPTDYGGNATNPTYHNTNYNIRWNIANSLNVPAIKTAYFAGAANVYNMAQRLGITDFTKDDAANPSMGIGSRGGTLLQMTGAYQAFANHGWRIPPHGILDIWDDYGHQLYHYDTTHPDGGQAISPQIAFMITSILKDENARFPEFGNDHVLSMWDQTLADGTHPEVGTKTGTTDNFTDNWAIGYTPDVVVGTWTGNADNSPMVNSIGITGAAPLWHSIIEYVSGFCNTAADQIPCPKLDFHFQDRAFPPPPQGVIQAPVNMVNGLAGGGYMSWMLQGEEPQQSGLALGGKPN